MVAANAFNIAGPVSGGRQYRHGRASDDTDRTRSHRKCHQTQGKTDYTMGVGWHLRLDRVLSVSSAPCRAGIVRSPLDRPGDVESVAATMLILRGSSALSPFRLASSCRTSRPPACPSRPSRGVRPCVETSADLSRRRTRGPGPVADYGPPRRASLEGLVQVVAPRPGHDFALVVPRPPTSPTSEGWPPSGASERVHRLHAGRRSAGLAFLRFAPSIPPSSGPPSLLHDG